MRKWILAILRKFVKQYTEYKSIRNIVYTLVDFDPTARKILVRYRRKSIVFEVSIDNIFELKAVLTALSANDSSIIGYLFGVYGYIDSEVGRSFLFNKQPNTKYILKYENRGSVLGIQNNEDGIIFFKTADDFLRNSNEMRNFDPLQAFYIGFLVGNRIGRKKINQVICNDLRENILKFKTRN